MKPRLFASPANSAPALRTLLALAAIGGVFTLGAWGVVRHSQVVALIAHNALSARERTFLCFIMLGSAFLAAATGWFLVSRGRLDVPGLAERTRRLAPFAPLALLPFLLCWAAWVGHTLEYLLVVLAVMLVFHRTLAQAMPLVLPRPPRGQPVMRGLCAVLALCAIGYAAYFYLYTTQAHRYGYTMSADLGLFDNLMWNLVHGGPFFLSTPAFGPTISHFSVHATFHAYLLAPFYAAFPRPETLLLAQAVGVAAGVIPLYFLALRFMGVWSAFIFGLLYLLNPALQGTLLYDFHFISMAPLFVFGLLWAIESERKLATVVLTILVLGLREEMAVLLCVLGIWQMLARDRMRLGFALALVGVAYFVGMKFVLMPAFAPAQRLMDMYQKFFVEGSPGISGVLRTILTNPFLVLRTLFDAARLEYVLALLLPLALLPFRTAWGAFLILPAVLTTLLPDVPPVYSLGFQYTSFWTPMLFAAAAVHMGSASITWRHTQLTVAVLGTVLCSYQLGGLMQRHTARGGFYDPFPFTIAPEMKERAVARDQVLAALPPTAKVAASERVVPHVSQRRNAYDLGASVFDADYIVATRHAWDGLEHDRLLQALRAGQFGLVAANADFALFGRGHGAPVMGPPPNVSVPDWLGTLRAR